MEQTHDDRRPWVAPELKQQSLAGTANNEGPGDDFTSAQALSDTIGSIV